VILPPPPFILGGRSYPSFQPSVPPPPIYTLAEIADNPREQVPATGTMFYLPPEFPPAPPEHPRPPPRPAETDCDLSTGWDPGLARFPPPVSLARRLPRLLLENRADSLIGKPRISRGQIPRGAPIVYE
jgi:hypothetical protein